MVHPFSRRPICIRTENQDQASFSPAEQPDLENHAVDEADDAWRHDANEMRLDSDDNGYKPEGP